MHSLVLKPEGAAAPASTAPSSPAAATFANSPAPQTFANSPAPQAFANSPAPSMAAHNPAPSVAGIPLSGMAPIGDTIATRAKRLADGPPGLRPIAHICVMLGLLMVIFARGCDAVALRYQTKLQAELSLMQNELGPMRNDDKKAADLKTAIEEAQKRQRDAGNYARIRGYWIEILFLCGTIVLAGGLSGVGFIGRGAEQWISMAMLAVILFSLYIGGMAWLTSFAGPLANFR